MTEGISRQRSPLREQSVGEVQPGGRKAYLAALATSQGAAFVRSVVLARLLGPEQMGLAAIIVVSASFFDAITDTGGDRFLVQDRFGGREGTLQLVHLVAILKGVLVALLLIAFAGPIARLTGAPQAAHALAALAIVPFLNGFTNYDFRIAQRHHQFGPEARMMLLSELCGMVTTIVAAVLVQDFTAVLYGLAARSLASVLVSQCVSTQTYRPRFSSDSARRFWRFSAPLMLNGLLIFLATQSDRIVVSRFLGLAELGRYTVVLLLGLYPGQTLMRFVAALYLPRIAGARDEPSVMRNIANQLESAAILLALSVAVGFALVVPFVLPIVFGSKFATTTVALTLLGLLTSWRMMKMAPTTIATAIGRTHVLLVNNFLRLSGVCAAIAGVYMIGGIPGVAAGLIAGEIVANVAASIMVNRATNWNMTNSALRYAFAVALGLLLVARGYASDHGLVIILIGTTVASGGLAAIGCWYERGTLSQMGNLARRGFKF